MNIKAAVTRAKVGLCIAAVAGYALLCAPTQAKEQIVTVAMSVKTADLDAGQPAGARELYRRLQHAAIHLCGSGTRVGVQPVLNFAACLDRAVGEAVRSANVPQLTLVYLSTHTLQQAAALGVDVPVLVAAK